jgi:hypothetical protein
MSQPVDDNLISEPEAAGQSGSQEWRGIVRRKSQQLQKGRNSGTVDRLTDRRYGGVSGTRLNQAQHHLWMGTEVLKIAADDTPNLRSGIPVCRLRPCEHLKVRVNLLQHRHVKVSLAAEIIRNKSVGNPGLVSDIVDIDRIISLLRKQLQCSCRQARPPVSTLVIVNGSLVLS